MAEKQTPRPDTAGQPNERALGTSLTHRRRREAALRLAPFSESSTDPLDQYQLSDAEVLQAARDFQDRWLATLAAKGIRMDGCLGVEFTAGGLVKPCCRKGRTGAA